MAHLCACDESEGNAECMHVRRSISLYSERSNHALSVERNGEGGSASQSRPDSRPGGSDRKPSGSGREDDWRDRRPQDDSSRWDGQSGSGRGTRGSSHDKGVKRRHEDRDDLKPGECWNHARIYEMLLISL